jgi:hypothetical protein
MTYPSQETISAYLRRNGWRPEGGRHDYRNLSVLWNHDEPGLRSCNGFPVWRADAVERQRAKDRQVTK